jgi:PAS domain S-box-containing protein
MIVTKVEQVRVLYIDDYILDRVLVRDALLSPGGRFQLIEAESRDQFDSLLHAQPYDLVLSDFNILGFTGLEVLDTVNQEIPGTPVIIVTGTGSEEIAAEAIKRGASDYVIKSPEQIRRLPHIIQQALENQRLRHERRAAQAALSASESRYRMVSEMTSDYAYGYQVMPDGDLQIDWVTGALERLTGYTGPEVTALGGWQTLLHSDDVPIALEQYRDLLAGNAKAVEYRVVTKDGVIRWVEDQALAIWDNDQDRATYIYGAVKDITGRKAAEEKQLELLVMAEALRDTALVLSSTSDFEQVLDRILENIGRVVTADAANFMLLEGDRVSIVRHRGYVLNDRETWDQMSMVIADRPNLARMVATRAPVMINNTHNSPHWEGLGEGEWIQSYAAAPVILDDGKVIGFLNLDHSTPNFFAQKHIDWLQEFTNQVAIALKNAQAQQALRWRSEELQQLTIRLAETEEAERLRLARELHDQVGQSLAVLSFNLNMLQDGLQASQNSDLLTQLDQSIHLVTEVSQGIRAVMDDLRPSILDDYGLQAALHWMTDRFSSRTQIKTHVTGNPLDPRLSSKLENAFFRITQEALTNIARHAAASQVTIVLQEIGKKVFLTISDDGSGFDLIPVKDPTQRRGWGMINMRERAEAVGGTLQIDSQIGQGTRLQIQIPRGDNAD